MEEGMRQLKIALYSPYLKDYLGGGERYLLTVASCTQQEHDTTIFFEESVSHLAELKQKHEKSFGLDLSRTTYATGPFGKGTHWFSRYLLTQPFDVFYYMTDGSFFFSGAKHNLLHIQIPIPNPLTSVGQKLKFLPWKIRVANSKFTKAAVERMWNVSVQYVHYGRCDINMFKPGKKEKYILSVGRFFVGGHNKKHDVLIEAFKKLNVHGWKLLIIGQVDPGRENREYVERLCTMAKGYPIEIKTDASFQELVDAYVRANVYWHAAGFGEDEEEHPERMEHMGLSTVEAMAGGCVPIVINKGGQKELVEDERDGFLWNSSEELLKKTRQVIEDQSLRKRIQAAARKKSLQFSHEAFCAQFKKILEEVVR